MSKIKTSAIEGYVKPGFEAVQDELTATVVRTFEVGRPIHAGDALWEQSVADADSTAR